MSYPDGDYEGYDILVTTHQTKGNKIMYSCDGGMFSLLIMMQSHPGLSRVEWDLRKLSNMYKKVTFKMGWDGAYILYQLLNIFGLKHTQAKQYSLIPFCISLEHSLGSAESK